MSHANGVSTLLQKKTREAARDGYTAVSIYEFSHPVEKGKPRSAHGDMVLDFDAKKKGLITMAILWARWVTLARRLTVRIFSKLLNKKYSVDPNHLQYFASGGKGFHLGYPAVSL